MTYISNNPYTNGYIYNNINPNYNKTTPWQLHDDNHKKGKTNLMSLIGNGAVKVIPDIAFVIIGVITEGEELTITQQENSRVSQEVINSLAAIGVGKKEIETESYLITPQYDFVEGRQIFRGYRVENNLKITVHNTLEVGKVIDTAVANGANLVSNIRFSLSNPSNTYKVALSKAVIDAVNKAISIEKTLNIVINKTPIEISEEGTNNVFNNIVELRSQTASTQIIAGDIEVVAKIKALFRYGMS